MNTAVEHVAPPSVPIPQHIGQATAIEQARAVTEVEAAVRYAHEWPRNEALAVAKIQQSCRQLTLAEKAFYRYRRGETQISGETIHLARELARCWRNIDYGLKELSRDDANGQSELYAFAWDMEANTRVSNTFILPHRRDKRDKDGNRSPEKLLDLRDVYEHNTNNGARRVRECIFAVLPPYIIEQAKDLCTATLKDGGGQPLPDRIAKCIALYGAIGVTPLQLEDKQHRSSNDWTEWDVTQLGIIYRSINRGEIMREDEFPQMRLTAAEILAPHQDDTVWPQVAQPADGA